TINGELMLVGAATIDAEGIDSASPRGMTVKRARDAWNKFHVIQDIAAVDGDVIQLLAGDHVGALAGVGLKLNLTYVSSHRNRFVGSAHAQDKVARVQTISRA